MYCLPPDASPDDCECTPDYLDCQSDYEEYSNWDAHCTRENPNQYYEYKCCLPKWYFAPMPDYDALEGQVILFKPCSVKTDNWLIERIVVHPIQNISFIWRCCYYGNGLQKLSPCSVILKKRKKGSGVNYFIANRLIRWLIIYNCIRPTRRTAKIAPLLGTSAFEQEKVDIQRASPALNLALIWAYFIAWSFCKRIRHKFWKLRTPCFDLQRKYA